MVNKKHDRGLIIDPIEKLISFKNKYKNLCLKYVNGQNGKILIEITQTLVNELSDFHHPWFAVIVFISTLYVLGFLIVKEQQNNWYSFAEIIINYFVIYQRFERLQMVYWNVVGPVFSIFHIEFSLISSTKWQRWSTTVWKRRNERYTVEGKAYFL